MMSPGGLVLAAEDAAVLAQRNAVIADLMERLPGVAISVWSARTNPRDPTTSSLLCYNPQFLELCDAASFEDGAFRKVAVDVNSAYFTVHTCALVDCVCRIGICGGCALCRRDSGSLPGVVSHDEVMTHSCERED